jgi:hypothetical protein
LKYLIDVNAVPKMEAISADNPNKNQKQWRMGRGSEEIKSGYLIE